MLFLLLVLFKKIVNDIDAISSYHLDMLRWHGAASSLALGWRNIRDQQIRFEALAGIADLTNKTILDAGCGYGDLVPFLSARYSLAHYYGLECIPELLHKAVKSYGNLPYTTFLQNNFLTDKLPLTDYILASGSLNYSSCEPDFIFKAITILFKQCRYGLGFNLLRSVTGNGLLAAYQPHLILAHCRSLAERVIICDDYAAEDFTVFVYHPDK